MVTWVLSGAINGATAQDLSEPPATIDRDGDLGLIRFD
jgi:hypothetical protein